MAWKKKFNSLLKALLIAAMMVGTIPADAQSDTTSAAMQSSASNDSIWTEEAWKKAKKGISFQKEKVEVEEEEEVIQNIEEWEWKNVFTKTLAKILAIVILALALILILYLLIRRSQHFQDGKLKDGIHVSLENLEEHLDRSDLDRFLKMTLDASDYKSSVRILYLMVIQSLHRNDLIEWKKDKTNRDFLNEMRQHPSYTRLRSLTLTFEIVWYGDTDINEADYQKVEPLFKAYLNEINNGSKK